jgi:hypothetical protein
MARRHIWRQDETTSVLVYPLGSDGCGVTCLRRSKVIQINVRTLSTAWKKRIELSMPSDALAPSLCDHRILGVASVNGEVGK